MGAGHQRPDGDRDVEFKTVVPARNDSYESLLRRTRVGRSLTEWRTKPMPDRRDALMDPFLDRAIDAFVWFEETTTVRPLAGVTEPALPDTYPFGV